MPDPVVLLDRVTKRFTGHTAVDALSLAVPPGVIYGLLGPNGAGKTTTLRVITNIFAPDEGTVRLFGVAGTARDHSARIGFLPEERGLYPRMRVLDVLVFLAETRGMRRRPARQRALEWLQRLGLTEWRLRRVADLSKGMQQKVQFISTMLHDPDLVILDEPFSGLDPVNAEVLRDAVLGLKREGKTVILSTHILEHAERLCDELCIIARGRKLVDGTLAAVQGARSSDRHVVVAFDGAMGSAAAVLRDPLLVRRLQDFGRYAEVEMAPGADAQALLRRLVASGARLSRFEITAPSLHTIFVDLVGAEGGALQEDARA